MNLRSLNVWRNRDGGSRSVILHLALAVGLVVAACTPVEESSATTSRQANTMSGSSSTTISSEACSDSVDFEDVSLGTMFSSGDGFVTGGVDVAVDDFVWDDGTLFGGGEAEVVASGLAGGSGNEVFTNNVLLRFGFPSSPLDGLSFDFGAHGGNLNIEINGDFVNFDSFGDIDGTTIGGVTVSVLSISGATGSLELAGTISDVAVGGQEFAIDNICGDPKPGEVACSDSVDFEDVSLGTMFSSGDGFVTGGVDVAVDDFVWDDGTLFGGGEAEVVASGLAGGSGNEVFTNNVLLRFGFPSSPLDGLSFDFGAHGGNLNIEINGDFVNFDSFGDIDGTTIGGVTVSVLSISGATGSLELAGTISDVAVGGQEFAIDNICGALDGELGVGNLL